jgi:hypothetical protein
VGALAWVGGDAGAAGVVALALEVCRVSAVIFPAAPSFALAGAAAVCLALGGAAAGGGVAGLGAPSEEATAAGFGGSKTDQLAMPSKRTIAVRPITRISRSLIHRPMTFAPQKHSIGSHDACEFASRSSTDIRPTAFDGFSD